MGKSNRERISLTFLFMTAFVCQMIAGAVSITVPIYAESLKASTLLIGLIGSAGGLVYSFLPFVAGILCDRTRRKIFVLTSLILYGCACLLYSLIEEASMLVFVKILEWASVAIFWPTVEALLADSSGLKLEETLRRFNLSWGLAMVIGPVIGGSLITFWSIKVPFIFSLFLSTIFGVLSIFILKEPTRSHKLKSNIIDEPKNVSGKQYPLVSGLASIFLFSSVDGIILTLFPAYASKLEISAFNIGWIVFAFGAARVVIFSQTNRIETKIRKIGMFLFGTSFIGVASLLTAFSYTFPQYVLCFALFGFGTGLSYAASIALVLGRWEYSRGRAAGVFESMIGLGYFIGPLVGGVVSGYSDAAPYYFGFVLSVTVFLIQLFYKKRNPAN